MHSDPIADMLTRLRNGYRAKLAEITIPYSRLKEHVVQLLAREGFVGQVAIEQGDGHSTKRILVQLRYDETNQPVLQRLERVSTPGLRRYYHWNNIPRIQSGLGMIILTTSKGLMTDREARRARVGGEAVCAVF